MKTRSLFLAVILCIFIAGLAEASIAVTAGRLGVPSTARDGAILLRPLPTVLGLMMGTVQVIVESQSAVSPSWGVGSTFAVVYGMGVFGMESQVGLQWRPGGKYLAGWYAELLPGFGWVSDAFGMLWYGTLSLNTGYQWVGRNGFAVNLAGGFMVSTIPILPVKPNLIFGVGYAYTEPRSMLMR